jgi:carotenoid cleavage dioxygenase-like enzyme
MAPPIDRPLPLWTDSAVTVETTHQGLVRAGLPDGVSGRLLGVHGDVVHSVQLDHGRELRYRSHRAQPESRTDCAARDIIVFGGAILVFRHGSLAHQLSSNLDTLTPVDLAGQSRPLSACPRRDHINGDLHLLATAPDGSQVHVVVSSGAFTRRNRPINDPPNRIRDVAIAGDHVLFASDGFLGIGSCDLEIGVRWIPTGVEAPALVHAHSTDDTVVAIAVTPSLERWEIRPASLSVHRQVLDPTPQRFGRTHHVHDTARQLLWTIGDRTADTYDLATGRHVHLHFDHGHPGDLVFVADPARSHDAHGGWLVGFVHDASRRDAELVVLDAADISRPAVAAARVPQPIPGDLHIAWIPEPANSHIKETDDAHHL